MRCPKCAAPLQRVPLTDGVELETCPSCSGVFYDGDELAIDLAFENVAPGSKACPKCSVPLAAATLYGGRLTLERCPSCRGIWFDAGEIQVLRMLSGAEAILKRRDAPRQPSPARPALDESDAMAEAAAPPRRASDDPPARVQVPDSAEQNNIDELCAPVMIWEGREYAHFQTSWPVVTYVLGEFPWQVTIGEQGKTRDFIHPPHLLCEDVAGEDTAWSHGTYVEPEEVWAAFNLEGSPPPRRGVAPAQPNPHTASREAMGPIFKLAAAACVVFFALALAFSQRREVFVASYAYPTTSPEKSFVTPTFKVEGRTSNLRLTIETNIDNGWAFFPMALINEDTGDAIDFAREVSFYSGVDDGEAWSEGSRRDVSYIPSVPAGTYYLRVEPESSGVSLTYWIRITRDVPQWSLLFWALALLAAPFALVWGRWWLFESARWHESDHPWITRDTGDKDDDE